MNAKPHNTAKKSKDPTRKTEETRIPMRRNRRNPHKNVGRLRRRIPHSKTGFLQILRIRTRFSPGFFNNPPGFFASGRGFHHFRRESNDE